MLEGFTGTKFVNVAEGEECSFDLILLNWLYLEYVGFFYLYSTPMDKVNEMRIHDIFAGQEASNCDCGSFIFFAWDGEVFFA
jgi:hypothetical protein